jgi:orotidine-5'-phosphate decarboxylase
MSDPAQPLIERARKGDRVAAGQLIDDFHARIYAYLRRLTGDAIDAEAAAAAAAEEAAQRTAAQQGTEPPLVLGVTVLTSMDNENLVETGVESTVAQQVERLAMLAAKCGLRGLVCSPLEIALLRQVIPSNMQLVTPGIRPDGGGGDDQKRTLTPREAVEAGGDWLVIGRPIYQAENPRKAAEEIMASLK